METADEFFYVNMTSAWICVSRAAGIWMIEQYEQGAKVLKFEDLYGRICFLASKDFESMWWSTPETRKSIREHNKTMQEEDTESTWGG